MGTKGIMDLNDQHCQGVVYRGVRCLDFSLRDAPRTKRSAMFRVEKSFVLNTYMYFICRINSYNNAKC